MWCPNSNKGLGGRPANPEDPRFTCSACGRTLKAVSMSLGYWGEYHGSPQWRSPRHKVSK